MNLPETYLKWLAGLGEEPYVEFAGREWELAGKEELLERVSIDGKEARYVDQAKLFVNSIYEATGASSTTDQDGNEIPFPRVSDFLTIGYDNEDLLCVDPSDGFSVWCFYPSEGGVVEKLAESLDRWTRMAKRRD